MRGSTAALMAAAALLLLSPALLMLWLVSPAEAPDAYEQETRRMFVEWNAKYRKTYKYAGEEERRYAVVKDARRRVAQANAAGVTTSGLSGHAVEEIPVGYGGGPRMDERSYEEETRRKFAASSSSSTPQPTGKRHTASTNSATSPTRRSANHASGAAGRWRVNQR